MIEAIFNFILEQNDDCTVADYNIDSMLDTAVSELGNIRGGVLPVTTIHRYNISVKGDDTDFLFPREIEEKGVLYKNMVHLGTFGTDEYESSDDKVITGGYDVIYDLDSCSVKVLYRVEISDDDVTTVYRVETDCMPGLYAGKFIVSFAVQLSEKLMDGAEYIRRVCDRF